MKNRIWGLLLTLVIAFFAMTSQAKADSIYIWFMANNGTDSFKAITADHRGTPAPECNYAAPDYYQSFVKWTENQDGSGESCIPGDKLTVRSRDTWYAQYKPDPVWIFWDGKIQDSLESSTMSASDLNNALALAAQYSDGYVQLNEEITVEGKTQIAGQGILKLNGNHLVFRDDGFPDNAVFTVETGKTFKIDGAASGSEVSLDGATRLVAVNSGVLEINGGEYNTTGDACTVVQRGGTATLVNAAFGAGVTLEYGTMTLDSTTSPRIDGIDLSKGDVSLKIKGTSDFDRVKVAAYGTENTIELDLSGFTGTFETDTENTEAFDLTAAGAGALLPNIKLPRELGKIGFKTTHNADYPLQKDKYQTAGDNVFYLAPVYEITFDEGSDGENETAYVLAEDGKGTLERLPTIAGYTYKWYNDQNCTMLVTAGANGIEFTDDATVYYGGKSINTYNIVLYPNQGSFTGSDPLTYEWDITKTKITLPTSSVERNHYIFNGWNDKQDGSGKEYKEISTDTITAETPIDFNLYADWTPFDYTINYKSAAKDTRGNPVVGTFSALSPTKYNIESEDITLPHPSLTGYVFRGWSDEENGVGMPTYQITAGRTGNVEVYAIWQPITYQVDLVMGAADCVSSGPTSYYWIYGTEAVNLPTKEHLTRPGYTLGGWFDQSGDNQYTTISPAMINANTPDTFSIYAHWSANEYTAALNANGGENTDGITSVTWTYETSPNIELPGSMTMERTGYTFKEWNDKQDGTGTPYEYISNTTVGNLTLFAIWEPDTVTALLRQNGGQLTFAPTEVQFTVGVGAPLPADDGNENFSISRPGHTFAGWYRAMDVSENLDGFEFTDGPYTEIANTEIISHAYVAKWTPNTYKLTYELDGGGIIDTAPQTFTVNEMLDIPNPTKRGYTFVGWMCEGTDAVMPNPHTLGYWRYEDTTLTAVWTPAEGTKYTVEHWMQNLDDPTQYTREASNEQNGKTGDKTKAYAVDYDGFTPESFEQQTIAADGSTVVSIYYTRNTYKMTLDPANGEEPVVAYYLYEEAVTLPKEPVRAGYEFVRWDPLIHLTMPGEDLTHIALWKATGSASYTVEHHFRVLGGTEYVIDSSKTEVLYGMPDEKTVATAKTVDGFTAQPFEQAIIAADGSTKIIVKYDRKKIDVTINLGDLDGDGEDDIIIIPDSEYGVEIREPETPQKPGYIFDGWVDENGNPVEFPITAPGGNITIKPVWKADASVVAYKVEYWLQELNDLTKYELRDTDTLIGTIGEATEAEATAFNGFTAKNFEQGTIAADGSTVVRIEYTRNTYKLTIDPANGEAPFVGHYLYGAALPEPETPVREGYTFAGWSPSVYAQMPHMDMNHVALWVSVADNLPVFTAPTANQTVSAFEGDTATMTVGATGNQTYQWYINRNDGKGFVPLQGATGATYTTGVLTLECNGYTYCCDATNEFGVTRSPSFKLEVTKTADLPATGDSSHASLWLLMAAMALLSMSVLTVRMRRN